VLDILELTELPARAVETGDYLRRRLRELALETPILGEVRGTGLLAGIDVLSGRDAARSLLERLVDNGVLAGLTGPRGDVLKVRPPLVWEPRHANEFVERLHAACP